MAKATLTYNISDPDDNQDFKRAVKSLDMAMALWDILQLKKGIGNILDQHGIIIDELLT